MAADGLGLEGSAAAAAPTTVLLHPLVILNISDHWTRSQVLGGGEASGRTVGALLGTQDGTTMALHTSFVVPWQAGEDGGGRPDWGYLTEKLGWQKQVYEQYELLGWYSAGPFDLSIDAQHHRTLMGLECMGDINPLYFTIDVNLQQTEAVLSLPIKLFQAPPLPLPQQQQQQQQQQQLETTSQGLLRSVPAPRLHPVNFIIETEEAERVAVDEIAKATKRAHSSSSTMTSHLHTIDNALAYLGSHLDVLLDLLTRAAALPTVDPAWLRRIAGLVALLPHGPAATPAASTDFHYEYFSTLLVSLMHTLTQALTSLNSSHTILDQVFTESRRQLLHAERSRDPHDLGAALDPSQGRLHAKSRIKSAKRRGYPL
jgi:COP9 signalosome complex subunit 6